MTQFLIARAKSAPDCVPVECVKPDGDAFLTGVALRSFGTLESVVVVGGPGFEMGEIVDTSISSMLDGASYASTPLFKVLESLMEVSESIAFFWASYPDDLPVANSSAELHAIVERQLRDPSSMSEVYVRWDRT